MSLAFNDTSTLQGLVQVYEDEIGVTSGTVSGNQTKLKKFTAEVNMALADFLALAIQASGTWQFDDSNHEKNPIIYTTAVQGRRNYTFTEDEQGNLILDIFKVMILPSAEATEYVDVVPLDAQAKASGPVASESAAQGTPAGYDKTANGFTFDVPFSYTVARGIKAYINREASFFTAGDTTKRPGVPGLFHRYFAVKPAYNYARQKRLANKNDLLREVLRIEADAREYFAARTKDEPKRLRVAYQNNR